jgi:uncharacterized protein YjbI with pentapeptide repeats
MTAVGRCKVCGRELYDEKVCVFHSPKADKDAKLFQRKLNEIFENKSLQSYKLDLFVFPAGISFPKEIDKSISFASAVFQVGVDFSGTTFQEPVTFVNVTFEGAVLFDSAVFRKRAFFASATFNDRASFFRTHFQDEAEFFKTEFKNKAFFNVTTFKGVTRFWDATFHDIVNFRGATIEHALEIDAENNHKIFSEEEVDFSSVRFSEPERVSIRKVDLSKFRFLGTDLRKVEFVDVDWGGKGVRNWVYDEMMPDRSTNKFDYPLIALLYKKLRANYEENLNYPEAGDFHVGEMECKRRNYKTWFGRNLSLTAWYKYVSNYGESYRRPLFFWILPILVVFPILFMYSGVEGVDHAASTYLIDYDLDLTSFLLNKPAWEKDYLKAFVYSLSVFSLVRDKQYRPIDNWGHFWMVSESILSPVLIALFLLALRRRFRR